MTLLQCHEAKGPIPRWIVAFSFASFLTERCAAINDDGHYSKEDDAEVLPIVLPIVLVVVIVCIIACCWQGKKCPCNKEDKKKKKKPEGDDNSADRVFVENEKRKTNKSGATAVVTKETNYNKSQKYGGEPPSYKTVAQKQKDFPGRTTPSNGGRDTSHSKRPVHSSRSHATSGYDTGENQTSRRNQDKYKVIDHRSSHKSHGESTKHSRYGRENEAYAPSEANKSSFRYSHKQNTHYYDENHRDRHQY